MIRDFHQPTSCQDAVRLKRELGEGAVFLAGGTEVNALHFAEPEHLISLSHLPLNTLESTDEGWAIGAMCTIQSLVDEERLPEPLRLAALNIVNRNIRNMATVGGQIACNKSCGDLIPALVAMEARVEGYDASGAENSASLADLLSGADALLLITRVVVPPSERPVVIDTFTRNRNDLSLLTVAVSLALEGSRIIAPILAMGGVDAHVRRLSQLEAELDGAPLPEPKVLEGKVASEVNPRTDVRGTAEFKRHLAGVLMSKAIQRAVRAAGGPS